MQPIRTYCTVWTNAGYVPVRYGGEGGVGTPHTIIMIADNLGSLDYLNSRHCYDLNSQLEIFFGDDNDENVFSNDISNCLYYDPYELSNIQGPSKCVMLSINVCSLMSKHYSLSSYINEIIKKQVNVQVIAIQEIWDIPYPELISIKNFKLIQNPRTKMRGGGGGILLKGKLIS
jgi:hypothetical protein